MKSRISWMVPWMVSMAWSIRSTAWSGSIAHELLGVLEGEAHGVERLDRAVMEVLGDALALLEHGQLAQLLVHAGVVDGQPGVARERLHEALVLVAEALAASLVGEVEVADDAALDAHRHAQEACAWPGGAAGSRAARDRSEMSGTRSGRSSRMITPSKPWPRGGWADGATHVIADAAGDEALEAATVVGDAQGGVSRARRGGARCRR